MRLQERTLLAHTRIRLHLANSPLARISHQSRDKERAARISTLARTETKLISLCKLSRCFIVVLSGFSGWANAGHSLNTHPGRPIPVISGSTQPVRRFWRETHRTKVCCAFQGHLRQGSDPRGLPVVNFTPQSAHRKLWTCFPARFARVRSNPQAQLRQEYAYFTNPRGSRLYFRSFLTRPCSGGSMSSV